VKHKKIKARWLGFREAGLATWRCPICKSYFQCGTEKMIAYCDGEKHHFQELKKKVVRQLVVTNMVCSMCGRKIENPVYLRIFYETDKGLEFHRDIPFCSDYCARKACIIWLELVKGCREISKPEINANLVIKNEKRKN
jgi:hypothetical protein